MSPLPLLRVLPACLCLLLVGMPTPLPAEKPMPGGWSEADVAHADVVAAANFAVRQQELELRKKKDTSTAKLTLISILSASHQVVAGSNYRLTLKVELDGKVRTANATVWHQAWNKETPYQLTAWEMK